MSMEADHKPAVLCDSGFLYEVYSKWRTLEWWGEVFKKKTLTVFTVKAKTQTKDHHLHTYIITGYCSSESEIYHYFIDFNEKP
ncbi:hypothetical protein FHS45_001328 [Thalassobacillus devorans]|nr:hypothetical protein [Thalassobacillus devorans]NIK28237.1 hypothetical protein [Thalassobacillus devorans]